MNNAELIARLKEQCDRDAAEHCPAEIIALQAEGIAAIEALEAEVGRWKALSVTNIMLGIVPGDGSGLEVYAKSVDDVVNKLTELGSKAEDVQGDNVTLLAQLAVAQGQEPAGYFVPESWDQLGKVTEWAQTIARHGQPLYAAPIPQQPSVPEGWKHDCNALCVNGIELWIDRCPHCGKPRQVNAAAPQPKETK